MTNMEKIMMLPKMESHVETLDKEIKALNEKKEALNELIAEAKALKETLYEDVNDGKWQTVVADL